MWNWFLLFIFIFINSSSGQILTRVHVPNPREYMTGVISEAVRVVEEKEWCNLKLPDFVQDVDEQVFELRLSGKIKYINGFVVSIQNINILLSSLLFQRWTQDNDGTVVELRGQLRMEDVALGFDVEVDLADGVKHYTCVSTHPLFYFDISVFKNMHTDDISVTVTGTESQIKNDLMFLPQDSITDALETLYNSNSSTVGVTSWAKDLELIIRDIILNKLPFPQLCYDCPLTVD